MTLSEKGNKKQLRRRKAIRQVIRTVLGENNELEIQISDIDPSIKGENVNGKFVPEYTGELRSRIINVPDEIYRASGIKIHGTRIKSSLFTTDVALIKNHNAHSVFAVYPFTPQVTIMQSIAGVASVPVFMGVGGGTTAGQRSANLAFQAEQLGAFGVVVNAPTTYETISLIAQTIDIPLIATISGANDDYLGKLKAGADMLNISAGADTVSLVAKIRKEVGKSVPIIATGGPSGESILQTIEAGANCITYTPPTSADIFAEIMKSYR